MTESDNRLLGASSKQRQLGSRVERDIPTWMALGSRVRKNGSACAEVMESIAEARYGGKLLA